MQVQQILREDEPSRFVSERDGLRCNDVATSVTEINTAREQAVTSFGSCRFEEPCEDLHVLGLNE